MLTYDLKKSPGVPLYEALYRCIRRDILDGTLAPGEKLPSKRALAQNLEISKITVEGAYGQLLAEGYIRAREKVGYFVEDVPRLPAASPSLPAAALPEESPVLPDPDRTRPEKFPFSVWSRLQREVMLDYGGQLLQPMARQGIPQLQLAIAGHLAAFRGMQVDPRNILIGAGTDFLYNLLVQLLGRDRVYALEEPGYDKIRKIYGAAGVTCRSTRMDKSGVCPDSLAGADVLHFSPSHHFPTGLVTPVSRRKALLRWAMEGDRYIIEDDYDSEFRFDAHPKPTMQSLDPSGRVIYMNTFSKSLAPSIRISYLVLPSRLTALLQQKLGFYACTVSSFEQYTLARFLSGGHFEKHINRMRKFYKNRRNQIISLIRSCPFADKLEILEEDAGLHFLLKVDTPLSDPVLVQKLAELGIRVRALSSFYHDDPDNAPAHYLVVGYAGIREEDFKKALDRLAESENLSTLF